MLSERLLEGARVHGARMWQLQVWATCLGTPQCFRERTFVGGQMFGCVWGNVARPS